MVDETDTLTICCPECRRTSHNPNDVREGYCGACAWWTSVPGLWLPWAIRRRLAEAGPYRDRPPVACVNDACAHLPVCQTVVDGELVDPHGVVDGGVELTFWWCSGCQWSGLAYAPQLLGLCRTETVRPDEVAPAWALYAPQMWQGRTGGVR